MSRRLIDNVAVTSEDGANSAVYGPQSTDIPDWALEQIGDHLWEDDGAGDDGSTDYSKLKKGELEDEVARRNADRGEDDQIEVEAPGNKAELIAALEADDAASG